MGTLSSSLNIAVQAMEADQAALSTTANNIANANTPGYSRQTVDLAEVAPVDYGGLVVGDGVQVQKVVSQQSSLLQTQFDQETQQQGKYNAFLGSMQQVQTLFNETSGTGLQSSITSFFNSIQQLSTNPSSTSLRAGMLTAAQNLAQNFQSTASSLVSIQRSADLSVSQSVSQINSLTSQIAQLNGEVSQATSTGQNPGTFIDQRDQLINQLSGLVDVSEINAGNNSLTLTTTGGANLVVGNQSFNLTSKADPATGFQHVYSQGADITSSITGGSLGGTIQARDSAIPSVLSSLDSLAANVENSLNSVNQAGTDLNGNQGGNLFVPPPANGQSAASQMTVAITDPAKIAASLDGSTGDNSNLTAMLNVQNQAIVQGQTPLDAYSTLIFNIGNQVSTAQSEAQSSQALTQQIQNQIGSISGVSINEEAANLIQFQQAYQAAAQVASVINSLTATAINLGHSSGATG
ncbi:MAG TPA: flagellar hook-associated protein FlgK [Candidatus Acidoferrales bacterium]|nr:flagellar hook-associated protein FlgK [Candidatus Acidoferrales bacterium]